MPPGGCIATGGGSVVGSHPSTYSLTTTMDTLNQDESSSTETEHNDVCTSDDDTVNDDWVTQGPSRCSLDKTKPGRLYLWCPYCDHKIVVPEQFEDYMDREEQGPFVSLCRSSPANFRRTNQFGRMKMHIRKHKEINPEHDLPPFYVNKRRGYKSLVGVSKRPEHSRGNVASPISVERPFLPGTKQCKSPPPIVRYCNLDNMKTGRLYLWCPYCDYMKLVPAEFEDSMEREKEERSFYVSISGSCPDNFRSTNQFKKMKMHVRKHNEINSEHQLPPFYAEKKKNYNRP
jgi:uncharacterized Zn finger protein (UPF0148 family)